MMANQKEVLHAYVRLSHSLAPLFGFVVLSGILVFPDKEGKVKPGALEDTLLVVELRLR